LRFELLRRHPLRKLLAAARDDGSVWTRHRPVGAGRTRRSAIGTAEGFDASRWVGEWLERPLPALGGAKPAEYMDTMEGQELISRLLAQAQSGAYA
jgi:hypothetical protein